MDSTRSATAPNFSEHPAIIAHRLILRALIVRLKMVSKPASLSFTDRDVNHIREGAKRMLKQMQSAGEQSVPAISRVIATAAEAEIDTLIGFLIPSAEDF